MQEDYNIRPYQPGDEEKIVQLLELVFDGWPKIDLTCDSLDHWKWKYLDNPYGKKIINVALINEKFVGVDHSIPLRVKLGSQIQSINYTSDLAVHPEFRRKGIAKMLINESDVKRRELDAESLFFVTRRPYTIKNYSKLFPFPVLNLVKIKNINKQLRAVPVKYPNLMKIGFHSSKIVNHISNFFQGNLSKNPENFDVIFAPQFDEKINTFFEKASSQYKFIVERKRNYLNWRYFDKRAGDFIVEIVEDDTGVLGYCVLRINRYLNNYSIGFLLDLLTLKNRVDVAEQLIHEAINYFGKNDVNIINCLMVKGHPYERILNRHGFLDSRVKFNLVTNFEFLKKGEELRNCLPEEIYFSYGDIDSLPVSQLNVQ
jgi:GNAT superfamily N-acetyltransferase